MPANSRVCAGFRLTSCAVSDSGRDGSATAIAAGLESLGLSIAITPEANETTAINMVTSFISAPTVNALACERRHDATVSFQNEFTNVFSAQNFSVFIPGHSGLVLTLGTTN